MNDMTREDALAHFGKKGMRWGVRNQSTSSAKKPTSAETAQRKADAKQSAKQAGKVAVKVGVRSAAMAGLVALGVPAVIAATSVAVAVAASPELVSAGKSWAKLAMDEIGIHNMSALENAKERLNLKGQELKYRARGGD